MGAAGVAPGPMLFPRPALCTRLPLCPSRAPCEGPCAAHTQDEEATISGGPSVLPTILRHLETGANAGDPTARSGLSSVTPQLRWPQHSLLWPHRVQRGQAGFQPKAERVPSQGQALSSENQFAENPRLTESPREVWGQRREAVGTPRPTTQGLPGL